MHNDMYEDENEQSAPTPSLRAEDIVNEAKAEKALLAEARSNQDVRERFRKELVPMAFSVYKMQMLSEDDKIAKAAADSVMRIEGSLGNASSDANPNGGRIVFNFNGQDLGQALRQVGSGVVRGEYEG